MGIKEIPTRDFIKFLESLGLVPVRTRGSHTAYNYPKGHPKKLQQPIMVRVNEAMIPRLHLHTNLQTLEISKDDFVEYQRKKLKGFRKN